MGDLHPVSRFGNLSYSEGNYLRLLLILISILLYISVLSPSIGAGDSGEFVASAFTLGIPHPPGYPFYMIIGRLFSLIFPNNPALGMNFLSAIFAILSALIIFQLLIYKGFRPIIALIPSLLFIFHPLIIKNATISEVYTLTSFFFLLELFLLEKKLYPLLSYVVGLSFFVHPLLWILGLYLIFKICRKNWRFLVNTVLGLSIVLYLPVRSRLNPLIDWGNPESFFAVFAHIFRLEYYRGVAVPFSFSVIGKELLTYLKILLRDVNFLLLLLPFSFRRKEKKYLLLLLIYSFPLALLLHFKPTELNLEANRVFFIPQLILILILSSHGLGRIKRGHLPIIGAFLLCVFCTLSYREKLFKRSWIALDYLSSVLEQTKDEDIPIIQSKGDALTFPLLYGEVLTGRIKIQVKTPGLKIRTQESPDYSTYSDKNFKFRDRLLFTKDKRSMKVWNFRVRRGRKDILEDNLYIESLSRYGIYLYRAGKMRQSLSVLSTAKEIGWINQQQMTVASAYSEIGQYKEAVDIYLRIQRKDPYYPGIYHELYYSLRESGKIDEADQFLSQGLLTQDDKNLLNDAGAYFAARGFINTAFIFFLRGITKGAFSSGENLNKLIKREILK